MNKLLSEQVDIKNLLISISKFKTVNGSKNINYPNEIILKPIKTLGILNDYIITNKIKQISLNNKLFFTLSRKNFSESENKKPYNPFHRKKTKIDVLDDKNNLKKESTKLNQNENNRNNPNKDDLFELQKTIGMKIDKINDSEEFEGGVIKENKVKKLEDIILQEREESAQEKYKEINLEYFKQKEIETRSQIYSIKDKLNKASKSDPEWGLNPQRKFLQRNFLKKDNVFYDFNKEELDDKKINYDYIKSLNLSEPITLYESFLTALKPINTVKIHTIIYGLMLPVIYYNFFFNYEFLFSAHFSKNFSHILSNAVFLFFLANFKLLQFYNKTLVTQIKYNGIDDTIIFYLFKGFNKNLIENSHKASELYAFRNTSVLIGDFIFFRSKVDKKLLYIAPVQGIYHEQEVFQNIFGLQFDNFQTNNNQEITQKMNASEENLDELKEKKYKKEEKF